MAQDRLCMAMGGAENGIRGDFWERRCFGIAAAFSVILFFKSRLWDRLRTCGLSRSERTFHYLLLYVSHSPANLMVQPQRRAHRIPARLRYPAGLGGGREAQTN